MTDRVVFLADWQVRAYLAGELSVLFVPMNPQPPRGWIIAINPDSYLPGDQAFMDPTHPIATYPTLYCNFAPGDTLLGKETYRKWVGDGGRWVVRYKADGVLNKDTWCSLDEGDYYLTPEDCEIDKEPESWASPVTMWPEVARIKLVVKAVVPVMLHKIPESDAIPAGAEFYESDWDIEFMRTPWRRLMQSFGARYGDKYPWDTAWVWRIEVA